VVRSIGLAALALVLSFAGGILWSLLFRANLGAAPDIPWAAVVMLGLMACTWWLLSRTTPLRSLLATRTAPRDVGLLWCPGCHGVPCQSRYSWFAPWPCGQDAFVSNIDMNALSMPMRSVRVVMASSVAAFFEEVEITPVWWTPRKGLLSSEIRQCRRENHTPSPSRRTPSAD
jgi:hypothetical protein